MEGWRLMYRNCHTSYNCGLAYERVEVKASAPPHVLNCWWALGGVEVKASEPPHVLGLWVGVRKGGG